MYLRHLLHLNLSRPDTLTSPQKHIKLCVDLTGCPSLCAALIYPNSGFPENPQISVKHNQPSTLHQAAGAYSVQLHKSHCNLCRVITGFRCLPLGPEWAKQFEISDVAGKSGVLFSVYYVTSGIFFCFSAEPVQSCIIWKHFDLLLLWNVRQSGWKCAAQWSLLSPLFNTGLLW